MRLSPDNRSVHRTAYCLNLLCVLLTPAVMIAQTSTDIVRGHVVGLDGAPIGDASVSVTGISSQLVRLTRTNSHGRFSVVFLESERGYDLIIRKIGYTPVVRRSPAGGASGVVTIDVVLAASAYPLEPLLISAQRSNGVFRPERKSIGGAEQDAIANGNFVLDNSRLQGLVALLPGVFTTSDSNVSVLGIPAAQNASVLDGMLFDGLSLPPDATCEASLAMTTTDPARGRFSGSQVAVSSCKGGEFFESTLRATTVQPALTWGDSRDASGSAQIGTVSGYVSGPLRRGTAHFRGSFNGTFGQRSVASLVAPRPSTLADLGLASDSIASFDLALAKLAIPVSTAASPRDARTRDLSAFLSLDWVLGAASALSLTAYFSEMRSDGGGLGALTVPAAGSSYHVTRSRMMVRGTTVILGAIDELTSALSVTDATALPYLIAPAATVRVGTNSGADGSGVAFLRFGGGVRDGPSHGMTWELRNQLSWRVNDGAHQLTFGQQVRVERRSSVVTADTMGSFQYQSLADLHDNQPLIYTRGLNSSAVQTRYTVGAAWLGDVWRASRTVSIQGGVRLDAAAVGSRPIYNAAVDSVFGRRTDFVPATTGITPRIGLAWLIHQRPSRTIKDPVTGGPATVVYADLATPLGEPRANLGPGITLFASIGGYAGALPSDRLAQAVEHDGLLLSSRTLTCVGTATPRPDWASGGHAVFSRCADGTGPGTLSSDQPAVDVFDPAFREPNSWRANIGLTGLYLKNWSASIGVIVSRQLNVESVVDLNLRRAPQFTLFSELNRPAYFLPVDVVAGTGTIGPGAGRPQVQFATVNNTMSDLHATAIQVNATLTPPSLFHKSGLRLNYSMNIQRGEQRGFGGTTAGDPWTVELVSGRQPVHQFVLFTPKFQLWWFAMGLRASVASGVAYTPMVAGDINGDGRSNDRAFVADPAATSDAVLARELRTLFVNAPASARACLQEQLGRIAATNSCRGPWQGRLDVSLDLVPPHGLGPGDRLRIMTRFFNAGAAVARLLGASNQGAAAPDPRLLYVAGFDPSTQRFRYVVNQLFGRPMNGGSGGRHFPPFQLQIGLEYKFGGAPLNPYLHSLGLTGSKNSRLSDSSVRAALEPFIKSPTDTLLILSDSLALTSDQTAKLREIGAEYYRRADSLVAPVRASILARQRMLSDSDITAAMLKFLSMLQIVRVRARDQAIAILTDDQRTKLAALLLNLHGIRFDPLPDLRRR